MAWSVWSCDTVTGVKQQRLPFSAFPWARVLNTDSSGSATLPLADSTVKKLGRASVRSLTDPISRTLVLDWDGVAVYAGIIWSRKYTRKGSMLTLTHSDVWSILRARFALDHNSALVASLWQETYSSLTLRQFAKVLMQLGLTGPADMNLSLPVVLPADEAGTISRTVYGYQLGMVADMLASVIEEGPDVDFQPRWVDNKLSWLMRVGSDAVPKLSAASHEWNLSAEQSGVIDFEEMEDAKKVATNLDAIGEGSEQDTLIRSNRIVNPAYPGLERVLSYKSESDLDALYALANSGLQTFKTPTKQSSFSILASGTPKVSELLPGDAVRVYAGAGDDWLDQGWAEHRLIQYSGDLSETVQLQFQPDGGV